MNVKLYNTLGREMQDFKPINEKEVGLYCCGPTVYNYAHIGNLRTYVFEDLLRRTLEYAGYNVNHVMNITDVGHLTGDADEGEDKMEKSARETGRSPAEIASFYTDAFFNDIDRLNIVRPKTACAATKHIGNMIGLIKKLEAKGFTYISGGNVYFDTSKFDRYGELALLDRQKLRAGARIAVDDNKKNPADFVLWFTNSKFENHIMQWDSPWGSGYPGWHVECSAMSMKYLGESFDIHCGGIDHIPIHHTNEIAQSEAASGKKWVNYWIHGEFLLMDKQKMAKSAGNFLTLQTLIDKGYDPLDYRYFCLGGHYRSQLVFNFESLDAARTARMNLVERIAAMKLESDPTPVENLSPRAKELLENFNNGLLGDLNAPKALAELWQLMKDKDLGVADKLGAVFEMDRVLGLRLDEAEAPSVALTDAEAALVRAREQARADKDWARADELRAELLEMGIEIKDTAKGTECRKSVNR
ncbi:MAG: cysteine--tRNA ligase [Spirochaetales bacterium]|uniref:Cysteine--tRNA ligase n=1 Tax=Candidatus Thalassospirochaeta sargassi TaxID=3119039 RepID=A0AAJ1IDP6_9SPIO|nr:cysteine--tRNA ligase [Spirochaetales bacterium]